MQRDDHRTFPPAKGCEHHQCEHPKQVVVVAAVFDCSHQVVLVPPLQQFGPITPTRGTLDSHRYQSVLLLRCCSDESGLPAGPVLATPDGGGTMGKVIASTRRRSTAT